MNERNDVLFHPPFELSDNKELVIVPGASHCDLYDKMDVIPFDRIEAFYRKHLR